MKSIERISSRYKVKKLCENDVPEIYSLCLGNPLYYEYMKEKLTIGSLHETLKALPPNKTMDNKFTIRFYPDDKLIAILDLITEYPNKQTAYIGWFIMCHDLHGKGIASEIMREVLSFLKVENFSYVELAYIKDNIEAEKFWIKHGFIANEIELEQEKYTLITMKKIL